MLIREKKKTKKTRTQKTDQERCKCRDVEVKQTMMCSQKKEGNGDESVGWQILAPLSHLINELKLIETR